jgi:hypothetical protein
MRPELVKIDATLPPLPSRPLLNWEHTTEEACQSARKNCTYGNMFSEIATWQKLKSKVTEVFSNICDTVKHGKDFWENAGKELFGDKAKEVSGKYEAAFKETLDVTKQEMQQRKMADIMNNSGMDTASAKKHVDGPIENSNCIRSPEGSRSQTTAQPAR